MLNNVIALVIVLCLKTIEHVDATHIPITFCSMKSLCSCVTNNGHTISLQNLSHLIAHDEKNYQDFRWEPCKTFNIGKLQGVTAVQHVRPTGDYFDIGSDPNVDFFVIGGTVQLSMVSQRSDRMSFVNLTCSHGKTEWIFKEEHPKKNYNFELRSPYCCTGERRHHKSASLSTGSILTIVFFVALTLYVVFGIIFRIKVQKAEGSDIIPNKDFWMELPGLIRDGFQFLASCGHKKCGVYALM